MGSTKTATSSATPSRTASTLDLTMLANGFDMSGFPGNQSRLSETVRDIASLDTDSSAADSSSIDSPSAFSLPDSGPVKTDEALGAGQTLPNEGRKSQVSTADRSRLQNPTIKRSSTVGRFALGRTGSLAALAGDSESLPPHARHRSGYRFFPMPQRASTLPSAAPAQTESLWENDSDSEYETQGDGTARRIPNRARRDRALERRIRPAQVTTCIDSSSVNARSTGHETGHSLECAPAHSLTEEDAAGEHAAMPHLASVSQLSERRACPGARDGRLYMRAASTMPSFRELSQEGTEW